MALIVQKFGGSSVATPERIRTVAERVAQTRLEGDEVVVVISAMGDTTDTLLALAGAVAPTAAGRRRRELDQLLATGEQAASALLALALEELGVPAVSLTGPQAEILTDASHTAARILEVRAERVRRALEAGRTPVVAGFQGRSLESEITTLGRGGSDTTAVALAVALGAERCEIYTDVDGLYSADPRQVPDAWRHERLSHREALLLTLAGAAVLHPRAAGLAASHQMPLRISSGLVSGPVPATLIEGGSNVEGPRILGVAESAGAARIRVDGPASGTSITAAALRALAAAEIAVEFLDEERTPDGRRRLTLIVAGDRAADAERALAAGPVASGRIDVEHPVARVTVVGTGLSACGAPIAAALQGLAAEGIEPEGIAINELGLTLYLPPTVAGAAMRILHRTLLESGAMGLGGERRSA